MPAATTTSFDQALREFFRAARRARGRAAALAGPVSLAQFHLLEPLLGEPHTIGRLACAADVAPPTATRMLDGLVERGLVARTPHPTDRRVVLVALTDEGREVVEVKRAEFAAARARVAAGLTDEERTRAAEILRKLAAVLEEL